MEFQCCWIFLSISFIIFKASRCENYPCAAKSTGGSVVCICNSTYCDNIISGDVMSSGNYRVTSSSKSGDRFKTTTGVMSTYNTGSNNIWSSIIAGIKSNEILEVDPTQTYQEIIGFGGAVTDAAGLNWMSLTQPVRQKLIESYYGTTGLEYNLIRTPIGGSDFSTHAYAYNELPEDDNKLTNFTLSYEDFNYKIPMIKAILDVATDDVNIVATTWSPPKWMKTNNAWSGFSRLKTDYYQTYADYHIRFIEEFAKQNISIWGITTTNEPVNGVIPILSFNSLGWTPSLMARWITDNLGPTLRNSSYNATKILAVDDQRYTLPLWINEMVEENSSVLDYIDGIAVHYYGDFIAPASLLTATHNKYPSKFILATEACSGSKPWEFTKVVPGSWSRAADYAKDIIEDLNNYVTGWIDWNLDLDETGGPNWAKNYVDSTIIIPKDGSDTFYKQPMYYTMGHFTKFIPRGSKRIHISNESLAHTHYTAFIRPDGSYVVVIYNGLLAKSLTLRFPNIMKELDVTLEAYSIHSIEIYP